MMEYEYEGHDPDDEDRNWQRLMKIEFRSGHDLPPQKFDRECLSDLREEYHGGMHSVSSGQ